FSVFCFLFSVFCFLFSVFCFLFSVFCFLFSVFCMLIKHLLAGTLNSSQYCVGMSARYCDANDPNDTQHKK
ncbi:MAG: hypothetical protein MUC61_02695, partial [Amoebophilaceae bacterium]|nr:hypothetical protein [Amoebophilaceae bacterium]